MKNNKLKLLWILFAFIGLFVISSCNNNNNSNDGDSNKTTQSATFTVTWKDGNGKVIETDRKVKYGDTPKYNGITPTKKATAQYEYTFSGWSPEIKEVTRDITYTAQFTESLVKYLISWNNEDGTLIKTTEVEYGKLPVFDGEEPTKESTVKYDYKFKGWYPELRAVTKNQSYKAQFDYADRYYNISFVNYDGSLLYSEKAKAYKSISAYTLSNLKPTRENDDNYSYTFVGWTPSVSSAVCDQVYTAEYSKTQLPYTFKFNLNGGICLSGINDKKTNRLDKRDFKFDLQKNGKAFRGWEYRGQLIFDKNGNLKINSRNFTFSSIMEFDALYEDEYHVSIQYKINGTLYYELPETVGVASTSSFYPAHGDVSVSALANEGYKFDGWYQGTSKITTNNTYNYTLWESDMTLIAVYSYNSYTLSVKTDDKAAGDIQLQGGNATDSVSVSKAYNSNITIYARAKDDKKFLGWYDANGALLSSNETYSFKMPNSNYSIIAKWNCFYINYDLNGGTNDLNNPSWYSTDMSNITLLSPRKDGYSFTGWEYNGQIIESIDTSDMCNMNLKATYTPLTYRIDLNSNGGSIDENYVDVEFDSQYDLPIPAKVGYKFEGWYCDDIQMTDDEGKSLSNYSLPSNETFIATYSLIPYQLEFDTNGGEFVHTNLFNVTFDENYDGGHIKNVSLGFDEKLEYPTTPSREGYYFSGWYLEPTCKTPYTFSNEIVEDFVLYAKWVSLPNNTDVMFGMEAYGNDMNDYFSYDPAGYEQSRPDYILVRANETGTHYIYYRSGTNATTASTSSYYKIGISIVNLSTNKTMLANTINTLNWHNISFTATIGDVICIGVYRNNSYNVYAHLAFSGFTKLESTAKTSNILGITYGSAFEYPTVKRDGYTFDGWTLNGNIYDSNNWNIADNGRLVAKWVPNEYTVTYDVNGGKELSSNIQNAVFDTEVILAKPERTGYTFDGWFDDNDTLITDGNWTISRDVKLTARWTIVEYGILYSLNDGINNVLNPNSYNYETETIVLEAPMKEGYTFIGWTNTEIVSPTKNVSITKNSIGDKSFVANWEANTYEITYDANGGNPIDDKQNITFDSNYTLVEPERIGYTFNGWYYNEALIDSSVWKIASNCTLIANWLPNTNTKYLVKHYQENANDDEYILFETDELYGTSDSSVLVQTKTYEGFNSPSNETYIILADGSLIVNYFYSRKAYEIGFVSNGGSDVDSIVRKYGEALGEYTSDKTNRTFDGWYLDISLTEEATSDYVILESKILYARWKEEFSTSYLTYDIKDNCVEIIGCLEDANVILIPDYIGGYFVTEIAQNAFANLLNVKEIIVPSTITKIGFGAFKGCNSLEKITLPFIGETADSVNYKGVFGYVFGYTYISRGTNDSYLYEYNLSTNSITSQSSNSNSNSSDSFVNRIIATQTEKVSVEGAIWQYSCLNKYWQKKDGLYLFDGYAIGSYYYYIPSSLKMIIITNDNTISDAAFNGCNNIENIELPDTVETIGEYAFQNCTELSNLNSDNNVINIPDSISRIAMYSFYNCTSIDTLRLSSQVELIDNYAFYSCTNLKHIDNMISVETLGEYAFGENTLLISVNSDEDKIILPNSLKIIGKYCFKNNTSILDVQVPSSVERINAGAFMGCDSLESIKLPFVGVAEDATGFAGVFGVIFGYKVVEKNDTYKYEYDVSTGTIRNCMSNSSSSDAFTNKIIATQTEKVSVEGAIWQYSCINLYESYTSGTNLYHLYYLRSYYCYIPDSLRKVIIEKDTTISDAAFNGCANITSITIPNDVISIGEAAFQNCNSLVRLNSFGDEIILPDTITSISNNTFRNCESMTSIVVPSSVISIASGAFKGCDSIESITLPFVGNSRTLNENYNYYNVLGYIFGQSTTSSPDLVQNGYYYTSSYMTSHSSITNSSEYAYIPNSLRTIVITDATVISEYAFSNCSFLTTIIINDGVASIGQCAFMNCLDLSTLKFDGSLKQWAEIEFDNEFANPMYYTRTLNVKVGDTYGLVTDLRNDTSITTINSYSFYNWNINSLTIPSNVVTIEANAFTGADKIAYLEFSKFFSTDYDGCISYLFGGNIYSSLKEIKVNSVWSIAAAFKGYSNVTKITLPDTLQIMYGETFYGCSSLTELIIPNGVDTIGEKTFYGCCSLTEVVIPNSVNWICNGAFQGCTSLTKITLPFVGKSRIDNSLSENAEDHVENVFGYIFGYHVYKTQYSTSEGCYIYYSGEEPTSDETLSYINEYYVGPESDNDWRKDYYYYYIPKSLREVVITDAPSIPLDSFNDCNFLTSITINEGVTEIGDFAFNNCSEITEIKIPSEVTKIGYASFGGCIMLNKVYYYKEPSTVGSNNNPYINALKYVYSEYEPADAGNYWHYVDGVITVW